MTEIAPLSKGAATESPAQQSSLPVEPRLPWGKPITSVQPHPTPIVAAQPTQEPAPDEAAKLLHIAQARADITGTGNIVDVIV